MMDTDPTRPDLSLVDTEHLIDALKERCDAMILARLPKANPAHEVINDKHGSFHTCLGMAVSIQHDILSDINGRDDDDDDS